MDFAHPIAAALVVLCWSQLSAADKTTRIGGFNDPRIADALVVIDLVDACKPGSIDYDVVKSPTADDQVRAAHNLYFALCKPNVSVAWALLQ